MTPVKSTNIHSIGYDQKSRRMSVRFNGSGTYHYDDVPPEEHAKLMAADSVGSHFHQHIRSKYKGAKAE